MSGQGSEKNIMTKTQVLNDSVFFAWTRVSRRSEQLAKFFNLIYVRYDRWGQSKFSLACSLIFNFAKTFFWVIFNRPKFIFTFQAHPFVTIAAKLGTWVTRKGIVIPDLHTAAYTDHFTGIQGVLGKWIWKKCPLILVHNDESKEFLGKTIHELKDKLYVLEDALPEFHSINTAINSNEIKCVLISRFAPDEPIQAFLEAVSEIENCQFYVTGNYAKATFDLSKYPNDKIIFTGFISDDEYLNLLQSSDMISILTTREMTLLSGGYEALSLEKPVILSNTKTLRNYFGNSAVYTNDTSGGIRRAIKTMISELHARQGIVLELKKEKIDDWQEKADHLIQLINRL
jgi:glycosyltransferase involved in cell wall biosynthesis